jgi:GNAT superfamily N-acetyltransferase
MRDFVAWYREHYVVDRDLIDRYFNEEFEAELRNLRGRYGPPQGSLLIAVLADRPAGCVALRNLGDGICEMKRMFVPTEFRRRGVGSQLVRFVILNAKIAGYRLMRLYTSKRLGEAIRFYERLGFRRTAPYFDLADDLKDWLIFFELDLDQTA